MTQNIKEKYNQLATDVRQYAVESDYFWFGIQVGIVGFEQAVSWADQIIAAESEPDIALIDIALAGLQGRNSVLDALPAVKGHRDPVIAGRMLLGELKTQLLNGVSLNVIASNALKLARLSQMPELIIYEFEHIADDVALVEQGVYANYEQVKLALITSLTRYQHIHAKQL